MRTKQPLILATLALLLIAAATGCADHDNDPTTPADNGLPVDFSSIRIAASANGTGGSTGNVPTTDEGGFYYGDVIHARLIHGSSTQEAWLTCIYDENGNPDWQASNPIYWQSTDPDTKQTLTLSRGEEGDFALPDDMEGTTKIIMPDGSNHIRIPNYRLHDRLFLSYRGPMPATPIAWELQHRMAQIVVTLACADGSTLPTKEDLRNARVSMTLPAKGHFDGVSGEVSQSSTGAGGNTGAGGSAGAGGGTADAKPVKFLKGAEQAGVHPHFAVALPGSTGTRIITITIPADGSSTKAEQTYQYTAPADITLEAGRSRVFRLSLGNRVKALSITTTEWQTAAQGPGVKEALIIEGVAEGGLSTRLPSTTGSSYGHIRVSGELNNADYWALSAFLDGLPAPVSLEIEITGGGGRIPDGPFGSCNKLGAVVLKGIEMIDRQAFVNSSLTSITLPEGLTQIQWNAFTDCKGLKSITLPSSVTYLGEQAFAACTKLASVSLPERLKTIESNAFMSCTSLKSITLPSKVTEWGTSIFINSGLTSVTLPEGMKEIPNGIFYGCADLQTITLPSTITAVGEEAFKLSGLTSIILPEGVKTIGEQAFMNCAKLMKVAAYDAPLIGVGTDAFTGTPTTKQLFDYGTYFASNSVGVPPLVTTWQTLHYNYQGTGDKLDPDSYTHHDNLLTP